MTKISTEALAFLDEIAAPMSAREIERALREYGVSKSQRVMLASAIWHLNIIAIQPKETRHD